MDKWHPISKQRQWSITITNLDGTWGHGKAAIASPAPSIHSRKILLALNGEEEGGRKKNGHKSQSASFILVKRWSSSSTSQPTNSPTFSTSSANFYWLLKNINYIFPLISSKNAAKHTFLEQPVQVKTTRTPTKLGKQGNPASPSHHPSGTQ